MSVIEKNCNPLMTYFKHIINVQMCKINYLVVALIHFSCFHICMLQDVRNILAGEESQVDLLKTQLKDLFRFSEDSRHLSDDVLAVVKEHQRYVTGNWKSLVMNHKSQSLVGHMISANKLSLNLPVALNIRIYLSKV